MARNEFVEKHTVTIQETGVDTDGSGQATIDVTEVREIDSVADVELHTPSGYVVNPVSVSGNTVTCEVRQGGGADTELALVDASSISIDVNGTARGY